MNVKAKCYTSINCYSQYTLFDYFQSNKTARFVTTNSN